MQEHEGSEGRREKEEEERRRTARCAREFVCEKEREREKDAEDPTQDLFAPLISSCMHTI